MERGGGEVGDEVVVKGTVEAGGGFAWSKGLATCYGVH